MTTYVKYRIKNIEPLRIADDSISQSGQTVSLRYVPGSSIRGYVINQLARQEDFEEYKRILLSDKVRFLNAYLYADGKELIPSLKGFYEDKKAVDAESGKKEIDNVVVDGEFREGFKRASLGRFCCPIGDTIQYYNVETGSDMKILIQKKDVDQKVFRNEYIEAGNYFAGSVAIEDEGVVDKIANVFGNTIMIGNARSQGFGKCKIVDKKIEKTMPYEQYVLQEDCKDACYMVLLSHSAMRDDCGEFCGLNLQVLEEKMGVSNLQIQYCASSTVDIRGYNRNWGVKIPSVRMYEQGSVFKLTFSGTLTVENMMDLMQRGIGIRKNEGFGQILFLKDYDKLVQKQEMRTNTETNPVQITRTSEDEKVLKIVAANLARKRIDEAIQKTVLEGVDRMDASESHVGVILSLLENTRYDENEAKCVLQRYFVHDMEKEKQQKQHKQHGSIRPLMEKVSRILEHSLTKTLSISENVMGYKMEELLSEKELGQRKMEYIIQLIRYEKKNKDKKRGDE